MVSPTSICKANNIDKHVEQDAIPTLQVIQVKCITHALINHLLFNNMQYVHLCTHFSDIYILHNCNTV